METAESLERSGKEYAKVWIAQRLKRIAAGVSLALAAMLGLMVLKRTTGMYADHHGFAEDLITAPRTTMECMTLGLIFIAFLLGVGMSLVQVGKVLRGPPKAGSTAEKTIRQFYNNAITCAGTIDSGIDLSAFVCLLDVPKEEIGGWKGFNDYWKKENNEMTRLLRSRATGKDIVTHTSFEVNNVKLAGQTEDRVSYEATIQFVAKFVPANPMYSSPKTYGPYLYRATGEVVRVGSRWYLCSGRWNAVEVPDNGPASRTHSTSSGGVGAAQSPKPFQFRVQGKDLVNGKSAEFLSRSDTPQLALQSAVALGLDPKTVTISPVSADETAA